MASRTFMPILVALVAGPLLVAAVTPRAVRKVKTSGVPVALQVIDEVSSNETTFTVHVRVDPPPIDAASGRIDMTIVPSTPNWNGFAQSPPEQIIVAEQADHGSATVQLRPERADAYLVVIVDRAPDKEPFVDIVHVVGKGTVMAPDTEQNQWYSGGVPVLIGLNGVIGGGASSVDIGYEMTQAAAADQDWEILAWSSPDVIHKRPTNAVRVKKNASSGDKDKDGNDVTLGLEQVRTEEAVLLVVAKNGNHYSQPKWVTVKKTN